MTRAAGVVFLAKDTSRCLLQLRNSDKRFKHTWGFFGGIIEKYETPYECLQRELEEEIGQFDPDSIKPPGLKGLNSVEVARATMKTFFMVLLDLNVYKRELETKCID